MFNHLMTVKEGIGCLGWVTVVGVYTCLPLSLSLPPSLSLVGVYTCVHVAYILPSSLSLPLSPSLPPLTLSLVGS